MEGKKLRIAVLGLGSVGSKVIELLTAQREKIQQTHQVTIEIVYGFVRSVNQVEKQQFAQANHIQLTENIEDILQDEQVDVVIELLGRIHPAKDYIIQALQAKKQVITANKDVIASYGAEIQAVAAENGVSISYEASVGGGIPIVHTLKTQFGLDTISKITGIMNGTTNFILTKMQQEQLTYEAALTLAQEMGFAESDPTNDVEGIDAAYKLMVLAQLIYGIYPNLEQVYCQGITHITALQMAVAAKFGYKIKLLGELVADSNQYGLRVAPFLVAETELLAQINDETNALSIDSQQIGTTFLSGPGAGAAPTATSVLADIQALLNQGLAIAPTATKVGTTEVFTEIDWKQKPEVYALILKKKQPTQKFSNEQLALIEKIAYVTVEDEAIEWLETTALTAQQLATLQTSLASLGEILGCLPFTKTLSERGRK